MRAVQHYYTCPCSLEHKGKECRRQRRKSERDFCTVNGTVGQEEENLHSKGVESKLGEANLQRREPGALAETLR